MKELIIIPSDGKDSEGFIRRKIEIPKKHVDVLNEYIKEHNIDLDSESSMYIQGVLMAMFGYCVIEISDASFNAFIPRSISKKQYSWFDENISEINKYTITAEVMDLEEGIIQIKKAGPGNNPIARLYTLLEKRIEGDAKANDIRRSK